MKTLFVTSFHTLISRNILRTDILPGLAKAARVVLFVPQDKVAYFRKEFGSENVTVEGIDTGASAVPFRSFFFKRLARAMGGVRTEFIRQIGRERQSVFVRLVREVFFYFPAESFGKFRFPQNVVRFFDFRLARDRRFDRHFETYAPAAVFSTDVQNEHDVALMKEARHRNIPVVAMVRSWDNVSVHGLLRIVPDKLIVTTEILKGEAQAISYIPEERIVVSGVPHYDRYLKGPAMSRAAFMESLGASPEAKLIFYAPIGDMYLRENDVDRIAVDALSREHATVLVRLPPTDVVSFGADFAPPKNVVFYRPGIVTSDRPTAEREAGRREMSRADDEHLLHSLAYADVVVTGPSTIIIDAALFNKPIVLIGFDGKKPRSYRESTRQYYDYPYMQPVMESGGAHFAKDVGDLEQAIGAYLADPHRDEGGRKKIVSLECFATDGKSAERIIQAIQSCL